MSDDIMLEAVGKAGDQWTADLSFRGVSHQMTFRVDQSGKLREVGESRFNCTLEGYEVGCLVERTRRGQKLSLPHRVVPGADSPRRPSIRDPRWFPPPVKEVWLVGVERLSKSRWLARLRLDDQDDCYEVDILPSDVWDVLRTPKNVSYVPYEYDLMGLIERMHKGERFALPFKLRPRWPTPPDPPALP